MDILDKENDKRNVLDKYKGWANELIKKDLNDHNNGFSVLMMQLSGDFNIGTVIRNANSFGGKEIFYYGPSKRFDRRSACGAHVYSMLSHLKELEQVVALKEQYTFVALEQTKSSIQLNSFDWEVCEKPPLILIGEEGCGLSEEILALCDYAVEIPGFGSVRSLNAGCASAIAMWDFVNKTKLQ